MTGLLALLDDVAALAKAAAVNIDDITAQIGKTSSKISGIIIDDAAVTPKYVVGLDPKRELAIIWQIAKKSVLNKLLFIAPIALLLGFFLPWIIQPILMIGGFYLCYEGYEKIHHIIMREKSVAKKAKLNVTPEQLEKIRVNSAVRTDLILSSEIMAVTYYEVATQDIMIQIAVLAAIAIGITALVYGVVALLVKMDDFGLYLAQKPNIILKKLGKKIVQFMPYFLKALSYVGTIAMLWVGAGIIIHAIAPLHHYLEVIELYFSSNILSILFKALATILSGIIFGAIVAYLILPIAKPLIKLWKK